MERQQQTHSNYNRRQPIVEDLRDKLNRMRLEKSSNLDKDEKNVKLPPPDPAYNFLKDPLRGDIVHKKHNKQETKHINESKLRGAREYLKQPININVEISSESGQRKCTLDESKIVEIPVVKKQYLKKPQLRRTVEFHQQYNKKNNAVFRNSNNNSNPFVTKIVENLHNDQESTKSNNTKCNIKKNISFNCKNEACIDNLHESRNAVRTFEEIKSDL